jgi:hypothetical protein
MLMHRCTVLIIVAEAVFIIDLAVDVSAQTRQDELLEDDLVEDGDHEPVEHDGEEQLGEDVGGVEGNGEEVLPQVSCFHFEKHGEHGQSFPCGDQPDESSER